MNIAICDDEALYANEIHRLIKSFITDAETDYNIDVFYDSEEIYNCNKTYDIALLDIEMSPYSGIDVAKKLKNTNPSIVFFIVTSFNKYLDDAMDLNVFRYIQKPIDSDRLKNGIEKAFEYINNNIVCFFLKKGRATKSISSNDILYVETIGRETKIVTKDDVYFSDYKMDFWKNKLIASFYYKVHKSFIVNMNYITEYKRDTIILHNNHTVPISYRKQAEFRKAFLSFIGGR